MVWMRELDGRMEFGIRVASSPEVKKQKTYDTQTHQKSGVLGGRDGGAGQCPHNHVRDRRKK